MPILQAATASRASSSATLWEEAPAPAWGPFSSPRRAPCYIVAPLASLAPTCFSEELVDVAPVASLAHLVARKSYLLLHHLPHLTHLPLQICPLIPSSFPSPSPRPLPAPPFPPSFSPPFPPPRLSLPHAHIITFSAKGPEQVGQAGQVAANSSRCRRRRPAPKLRTYLYI